MAYQARQRDPLFDRDTQAVLERRGKELLGAVLLAIAVAAAMVLGSYSQDDPSWMSITNEPAQNLLGRFGATLAQPIYVIVGWGGWAIPLLFAAWGLRFVTHRGEELAMSRAVFGPILVAVSSVYAATHLPSASWTHSFGMGGMLGDTVLGAVLNFLPFGQGTGLKLLSLALAVGVLAIALFSLGFTRPELDRIGRFLLVSLVMTYARLMRWARSASAFVARLLVSGGSATLKGSSALASRAADWQASRREARATAKQPARMAHSASYADDYDEVFEDEDYAEPEPQPVMPRRAAAVVRPASAGQPAAPQSYVSPSYAPQAYAPASQAYAAAPQPAPVPVTPLAAAPAALSAQGEWGAGRVLDQARLVRSDYTPTGWQAIDAYQPVQRPQPKPSLLSRVPSFLMRQVSPAAAAAPAVVPAAAHAAAHAAVPAPQAAPAVQAPPAARVEDALNAKIASAIHARRQQVVAPVRSEPPLMRPKGPKPILFDPSKYPTGRAARAAQPAAAPAAPAYAAPALDAVQPVVQPAVQAEPVRYADPAPAAYRAPEIPAEPYAAPDLYDAAEAMIPSREPAIPDFDDADLALDAAGDFGFDAPDAFDAGLSAGEAAPQPAPGPVVKPRVMLRATAATVPDEPAQPSPPLPVAEAGEVPRSGSRLIRAGQGTGAFAEVQGLDAAAEDEEDELPVPAAPQSFVVDTKKVVMQPLQRQVLPSKQARAEAQPRQRFEDRHPGYEKPPLALLMNPEDVERHLLSDEQLEENARLLETVLDDYGVRGEIVSVRPGPVVTMYELEPAPGLKASRVIGLSDDIARSMKALSARVSTVPGRSVIGIELPNERREKVVLREIMSARDFGDANMRLPLALGKDIGGEPVVANLAKMPHLLIAGTTGSGKSVAINTMILSLLYRLTPEECRLIMIDPKMLELSVYDGIPHLLSPVVTDPKKAVVALKWVVGEMEERYRKMSKMGVRNIEGYNGRVRDALAKGEMFKRTIQTGFDEETGDPIFETDEFEPQPFPYIVVIVDEMADLMMVAGKEIEACIQRLAQMARASGIHLIMATQRPSVDVITGTIKANFPTRISFQVTSKIDSRTILGEMGAEQLLGMGDMLYMAGGGRISRVHGPFVSDEEVEEVVNHLKSFGPPEYVGSVVEGPDDSERSESGTSVDELLGLGSEKEGDEALYDMAVAIVAKDRKCSTSYIQRKLAIGYNKAARLVEQMEEQGIVSRANHVGKREILVPEVQ